ncbi:hypothetical protein Dimus_018213 [Dionaea muscipula]
MEEEVAVMEALLNGGREEQMQAAAALQISKLTSKQKHRLVDKGVIKPLVSMLNSRDCDAVEAALVALLNLAYGSERNKKRIAKSGAMPILIALLQCERAEMIELAITTLFILSSCAGNKLMIASSGAIPLLVELLARGDTYHHDNNSSISIISISVQAKIDAISTLHNLSTSKQLIPRLISSGLMSYLLQEIIGESSKRSVEKSMALLESIVSSSDAGLKRVAAAEGAVQALVETIEEGSPECKEHAVGILLLMCQSCRDKYRGILLREGVMPGLLQLSVEGTWRAKNLARTLLLLLRECSSSRELKKSEILEQIMERIDAEDGFNGTSLSLVEQMIAKLASSSLCVKCE